MPEKDTLAETEALLAQTEALIREAESKCQETTRYLQELGLERESGRNFMSSDKAPLEERQKAAAELAAFQREIDDELAQAAAKVPGRTSTSSAPMRARMMRV